jgi:mono/diheme cytochrome c family protein
MLDESHDHPYAAVSLIEGEFTLRLIPTMAALTALCCATLSAADATAGKDVFDKSCKSCHGADGTPNPGVEKMMKVDIKDLKSAAVQGLTDADLKAVITSGKGKMKPIASVTGASIDNVIAFVRSLKK